MKNKNIVFVLLVLIIVTAAVIGVYSYMHRCNQILREVDRYALPKAVEFMKALDGWNYQEVKPFLTDKYIDSLSVEEWQDEFDHLKVLGKLESFARPHFVSHQPFKKYRVCESAIDVYSVASEFEKDNAVIRIFFENNCGKLKISSFLVTSKSIEVKPDYLQDYDGKESIGETIEGLIDDDIEEDLDLIYENNQEEDSILPELDDEKSKNVKIINKESKNNSHGKAYRY